MFKSDQIFLLAGFLSGCPSPDMGSAGAFCDVEIDTYALAFRISEQGDGKASKFKNMQPSVSSGTWGEQLHGIRKVPAGFTEGMKVL